MDFKVVNSVDQKEYEKEIIMKFLSSIDPIEISNKVANSMGWGDGDPIAIALAMIKEKADKW